METLTGMTIRERWLRGDRAGTAEERERYREHAAGSIIPFSPRQAERDAAGLRSACAACGNQETEADPLVISCDGMRIHLAHVITETDSGFYGTPFAAAS